MNYETARTLDSRLRGNDGKDGFNRFAPVRGCFSVNGFAAIGRRARVITEVDPALGCDEPTALARDRAEKQTGTIHSFFRVEPVAGAGSDLAIVRGRSTKCRRKQMSLCSKTG